MPFHHAVSIPSRASRLRVINPSSRNGSLKIRPPKLRSPHGFVMGAPPFTQNIRQMLKGNAPSLPPMRMRSSSCRCSTAGAAHLLIATRWILAAGGLKIEN
jgi:hypothetical protein